jgi:hypothetical protein
MRLWGQPVAAGGEEIWLVEAVSGLETHELFAPRCPLVFPQPFHPLHHQRDLRFAVLTTSAPKNCRWLPLVAIDPFEGAQFQFRLPLAAGGCLLAVPEEEDVDPLQEDGLDREEVAGKHARGLRS